MFASLSQRRDSRMLRLEARQGSAIRRLLRLLAPFQVFGLARMISHGDSDKRNARHGKTPLSPPGG